MKPQQSVNGGSLHAASLCSQCFATNASPSHEGGSGQAFGATSRCSLQSPSPRPAQGGLAVDPCRDGRSRQGRQGGRQEEEPKEGGGSAGQGPEERRRPRLGGRVRRQRRRPGWPPVRPSRQLSARLAFVNTFLGASGATHFLLCRHRHNVIIPQGSLVSANITSLEGAAERR